MKTRANTAITAHNSLFPLLVLLVLAFSVRAHAQIVIIANPGVSVSEASISELRDLFIGASSSLKGESHLTPVILKQGPVHEEFLAQYVGKSDAAFRATWRSVLFSGQGVMPRTFDSDAAVVDYVAHHSGAIGYVAEKASHQGTKVLAVR
jgi:hypothetical protein